MEDLPPKGIRKSSSKTSLDREESWRRKPVKKRKKTLELVPGEAAEAASASNPFTTSVGRHSLYNSSNKGAAATSSSKAAASNSKAEKNLDNPKASQSHRRSKSAASLLSSKLQVYCLVCIQIPTKKFD